MYAVLVALAKGSAVSASRSQTTSWPLSLKVMEWAMILRPVGPEMPGIPASTAPSLPWIGESRWHVPDSG